MGLRGLEHADLHGDLMSKQIFNTRPRIPHPSSLIPMLPDRLPEYGEFAMLYRWLNQLRDHAQSITPAPTPNALLGITSIGTTRRPVAEPAAAGEEADARWS